MCRDTTEQPADPRLRQCLGSRGQLRCRWGASFDVVLHLLKLKDLAGYRGVPVFIRSSRHIPPSADAARILMLAFFEKLAEEDHPAVRAALGHFHFVRIHPYVDGNGRLGRLLMNLMLASGGYPWTIVPVQRRDTYMAALERASVNDDVGPLAEFLGGLVSDTMGGKLPPPIPEA